MRISTSQIYSVANIGMRDAQYAVDQTHQQLSSGKRVLSPADDPVAATSILTMTQELSRTTQFQKNIDSGDSNLKLEDSTLQSITNIVQSLRELAVSAGNTAVFTDADYKSMSAIVSSRLEELLSLQNTKNSSGQYIFAGFQSDKPPFVNESGGNYSYKGDQGQLLIQASSSIKVPVGDSGQVLFMDIPSSHNTFNTFPSPTNTGNPAAVISIGDVVDQVAYDKFFPQDMKVTFNANSAVNPPTPNYTVTDRATGKVLVANKVFTSGDDIIVNGAKFSIYGSPSPGAPSVPANINFGAFAATDFSALPVGTQTLTLTVGGVTETLTLDQNITTPAQLVTALGGDSFYPDPVTMPISGSPSAIANHAKLQNLGLTLTSTGFTSASGLNITVKNGSSDIDTMLGGVSTQASGSTTVNLPFNFGSAVAFSGAPKTVDITVNGKTETLTLNTDVTDSTTLAAAFNTPANYAKLTKLGVTATPQGLISKTNSVITLNAGDTSINQVTGTQTLGTGTSSSQGVLATPGDSFIIESTNKQGLLTSVSRFSEAIKNVKQTAESKAELSVIVAKTLTNLQNVIDSLASSQGEVGARQNMLESIKDLHADNALYGESVLSTLQDVNYAEASTRLQLQTMVLSASQQSFIKISQLSLFTYM
ncbi:MAG TPA: flagellar hook-associated protein FlgL [Cellvibrio sp.]|nr:flagellar hook-associated protein FlgL [Cellvibrio sp.]